MIKPAAVASLAVTLAAVPAAAVSTYQELLTRPHPTPDRHVSYGKDALQVGDLYMPKGRGPFPAIVLVHGGCWLADLPGRELMDPMVEPLRARGFAVWNIEYRRIGHEGGGYPGTFLDTASAIDELYALAPRYHLDLARIVTVGHSAGGHLAIWAAARSRIAQASALYKADPLPIHAAVSLSGILDLEAFRGSGPDACGGPPTIDGLIGKHANPYADTSPARLVPSGVHQVIFSGNLDHIVPAPFGHAYAKKAKAAGDRVDDIEIKGAGHFEMIDPKSAAWPTIEAAIAAAAK